MYRCVKCSNSCRLRPIWEETKTRRRQDIKSQHRMQDGNHGCCDAKHSERLNTQVDSTQNYWSFGLCPLSGILKKTRKHVLGTDPVSEMLCIL
jgi:hypothetical protein